MLDQQDMSVPEAADKASEQCDYGYKRDFRTALSQIIAVSIKNMLLLVYGMALGFPTILIPAVKNPAKGEALKLDISQISWIGSMNLIVVPLGCALSGALTAPIGRRRAMQLVNLPFFMAWLIFYFSSTTAHLYVALCLIGLAGGLLEAPVLTYVAEITQPHLRGALSATSSMSIIVGVFGEFLLALLLPWRSLTIVNAVVTCCAVLALWWIPESPHWLVSKNKHTEARKSLQWLRGWTSASAVELELRDIQSLFKKPDGKDELKAEGSLRGKLRHYAERRFLAPFALVCSTFFVGHFSGMTTLQTYAVSIFQSLRAPIDAQHAALALAALQIAGAAVCVALVSRVGKRPLALLSTAGAALCCLLIADYDYNARPNYKYSEIPTTLLMLLAFITHTGLRLLPWILIGEVFSAETRAGAAGLASAVGYVFGFLTNKLYLYMVEAIAIWGTYGFYGIICVVGCLVLYCHLPETEGRPLTDIDNHFSGIKPLGNKVYRSQKRPQENEAPPQVRGETNLAYEDTNF